MHFAFDDLNPHVRTPRCLASWQCTFHSSFEFSIPALLLIIFSYIASLLLMIVANDFSKGIGRVERICRSFGGVSTNSRKLKGCMQHQLGIAPHAHTTMRRSLLIQDKLPHCYAENLLIRSAQPY